MRNDFYKKLLRSIEEHAKLRRGSMIVEGAVFLPVYIFAAVALILLIKACWLDIIVYSAAHNEIAENSSIDKISVYLELKHALNEAGADGNNIILTETDCILDCPGMDNLKKYSFIYDTEIRTPDPLVKHILLKNSLVSRKWTGFSVNGSQFGFDNMSLDENGHIVYIFPRSGGRYHEENCRYVNAQYETLVLNDSLKNRYDPCSLCIKGDEPDGQEVCIFKYGSSYHNKYCTSVDKFVIKIDERDAVIKNYTPCSICGG